MLESESVITIAGECMVLVNINTLQGGALPGLAAAPPRNIVALRLYRSAADAFIG
jgi:hypothetical protein